MKKALVTGGTKGIGLAIVEELLDKGYFVITTYASDDANANLVNKKLCVRHEDRFVIIKKHMESENDIQTFIQQCNELHLLDQGLDVIVLNAGCTDRTRWGEMNWNQWMHVMDVNLNAPAALVREMDNALNDEASIVFISSDMSVFPHASSVPYTVSKAGINGLTKALVKEYADRAIRVNAVLPGFVDTPWQKEKPLEQKKRICDKVALHRFAEPDEIAEVVMNIISSTYMNGSLVQVDGGYCYR